MTSREANCDRSHKQERTIGWRIAVRLRGDGLKRKSHRGKRWLRRARRASEFDRFGTSLQSDGVMLRRTLHAESHHTANTVRWQKDTAGEQRACQWHDKHSDRRFDQRQPRTSREGYGGGLGFGEMRFPSRDGFPGNGLVFDPATRATPRSIGDAARAVQKTAVISHAPRGSKPRNNRPEKLRN